MTISKIVIALGGNAILPPIKSARFEDEIATVKKTAKLVAEVANKHKIIITHGNGPQVGNLLLQQLGSNFKKSLDVLGSETQAEIGYLLQQHIENNLTGQKKYSVITLITQVLVDKNDKAFKRPTKPIGPFFPSKRGPGYVRIDKRGFRLVVPSPKPIDIIEKHEILDLYSKGYIIIASGGGGIPVVKERGQLKGVRAVIDKDRSAALLAKLVNADVLLILTDVDGIYFNWGKKSQKLLKSLSLAEAKKLLATGELQEGSMGPKVEAAIDFVSQATKTRKVAVIANLHDIKKALQGKAGTVIMR